MRVDEKHMAITIEAYMELVAIAERVNAVQRLVDAGGYISLDSVLTVLNVKMYKKEEANG